MVGVRRGANLNLATGDTEEHKAIVSVASCSLSGTMSVQGISPAAALASCAFLNSSISSFGKNFFYSVEVSRWLVLCVWEEKNLMWACTCLQPCSACVQVLRRPGQVILSPVESAAHRSLD